MTNEFDNFSWFKYSVDFFIDVPNQLSGVVGLSSGQQLLTRWNKNYNKQTKFRS